MRRLHAGGSPFPSPHLHGVREGKDALEQRTRAALVDALPVRVAAELARRQQVRARPGAQVRLRGAGGARGRAHSCQPRRDEVCGGGGAVQAADDDVGVADLRAGRGCAMSVSEGTTEPVTRTVSTFHRAPSGCEACSTRVLQKKRDRARAVAMRHRRRDGEAPLETLTQTQSRPRSSRA